MEYLFYLALGAVAGLISGLFGLGGGAVIVPLLIVAFGIQGVSSEISTHLAIGTSLATILATSVTSIYTHHQKNGIRWDLVKRLTPGIVVGSALGGMLSVSLGGVLLQLLFGSFMIFMGLQMLLFKAATLNKPPPPLPLLVVGSTGIGAISALVGIGGGSLMTPFLAHLGVKMRQAVGSAAACGFPIALTATLVYSTSGDIASKLPGPSLGYILLPAWIGIIITSTPCARLGALMAHRVNERLLKQAFGCFILLLGSRFIWVNIPI